MIRDYFGCTWDLEHLGQDKRQRFVIGLVSRGAVVHVVKFTSRSLRYWGTARRQIRYYTRWQVDPIDLDWLVLERFCRTEGGRL